MKTSGEIDPKRVASHLEALIVLGDETQDPIGATALMNHLVLLRTGQVCAGLRSGDMSVLEWMMAQMISMSLTEMVGAQLENMSTEEIKKVVAELKIKPTFS